MRWKYHKRRWPALVVLIGFFFLSLVATQSWQPLRCPEMGHNLIDPILFGSSTSCNIERQHASATRLEAHESSSLYLPGPSCPCPSCLPAIPPVSSKAAARNVESPPVEPTLIVVEENDYEFDASFPALGITEATYQPVQDPMLIGTGSNPIGVVLPEPSGTEPPDSEDSLLHNPMPTAGGYEKAVSESPSQLSVVRVSSIRDRLALRPNRLNSKLVQSASPSVAENSQHEAGTNADETTPIGSVANSSAASRSM
jgi:hypothetical protein